MEYKKIKKGDVVKFNAKAKKELTCLIDEGINDGRQHVIKKVNVYPDLEYVQFEDGGGSDVFWLTLVSKPKQDKAMKVNSEPLKTMLNKILSIENAAFGLNGFDVERLKSEIRQSLQDAS